MKKLLLILTFLIPMTILSQNILKTERNENEQIKYQFAQEGNKIIYKSYYKDDQQKIKG